MKILKEIMFQNFPVLLDIVKRLFSLIFLEYFFFFLTFFKKLKINKQKKKTIEIQDKERGKKKKEGKKEINKIK
jgi:hypothetical protein